MKGIMEQTILSWLQKIDKRQENIETQVLNLNDRIKSFEKSLKFVNVQNKANNQDSGTKTKDVSLSEEDNFINHVKAELKSLGKKSEDGKERSKVKKANSFMERSSVKKIRVRRNPHTVPSDKDEERRLTSFRRECLSKAIQWNLVDLINAVPEQPAFVLPKWLSREDGKFIMEGYDRENHFRRFLCVLIQKEFETMQDWLKNCGFDEKVVMQVWLTFEEFSDKDANRSRMKCFLCRLIENVNVVKMVDYLFSADILKSQQEYLRICSSERPVGAQDDLWKYVITECKQYVCPEIVTVALKVALTDHHNKANEAEKHVFESLLSDISIIDAQDLLECSCKVRCSQSLHPPSCLKTMSLAGVYFSPPTQRKSQSSSSSSEGPQSSSSPSSSAETIYNESSLEKRGSNADVLSPDDETILKQPSDTTSDRPNADRNRSLSNFKFQTQSSRPRSLQRRRSQHIMENSRSDSSLGTFNEGNKKELQVRSSYKSVSNRLENKPSVIPVRANVVHIHTGTHIQMNKERSSESASEH